MKVDDASVAAPAGSLQDEDDFTTALYRAAIGPMGTATYLPAFSRFEAAGRAGLGWNWAASLLTLNWLIFRQLWAPALAYVGALTVALVGVFGIGRLVFQMPQELEIALLLMMGVFAFGIPGLFGNAWFYNHCQARVAQSLAAHTEVPAACAALNKMSSKRPRAIALAIANALLIAAAFGLYSELSAHTPAHPLLPATSSVLGTSGLQSASGVVGIPTPQPAASSLASPAAPAAAASPASPAMVAVPAPSASTPAATASAAVAPASSPMAFAPAQAAMPVGAASAMRQAASAPVTTASKPATADTATSTAIVSTTAPQSKPSASKAAASKAADSKVPATKPAIVKTPVPKPPAGRDTYLINVGLFAQEQNANAAYAKLIEAGHPATIQPFATSKGLRIRVRVGPFANQSQAEASAANVRALGLEAIVFKP